MKWWHVAWLVGLILWAGGLILWALSLWVRLT